MIHNPINFFELLKTSYQSRNCPPTMNIPGISILLRPLHSSILEGPGFLVSQRASRPEKV